MTRAVLDTVVFVRALINPKGSWGRLLFDLSDRYTIIVSREIVEEVIAVVARPRLLQRFPQMSDPARVFRMLALLSEAEFVDPDPGAQVCRDPNDDKFLHCAVGGQADYIVSEDNDILAVGEYRGIKPVTAAEFITILEA